MSAIIDQVFSPLYGKFCWKAGKGYSSFLTFEFGEPNLEITQWNRVINGAREKRRSVRIHGEWHLWIYICDWEITYRDEVLAKSDSRSKLIHRAIGRLDGQKLLKVIVEPSCKTIFDFEYGERLTTFANIDAYGEDSQLWLLYEPSGNVFSLRADRKYSHGQGNISKNEDVWKDIY